MSPARPTAFLLTLLLACGAAACKDDKPVEPGKPIAADTSRDTEQAKAALMALPELKTWSVQIEQASKGATHPALMEDGPQTVNGKKYWQLTFAEDGAEALQRRETFLVAERGDEILVRDFETDKNLTLAQWRASRPVVR
ncbi:hypothetical protein [Massilia sp. S19_KUP03_FR1]|uniref:hypothetical protein n=1 Tax=Massilia sp. S19_KUP03_FR1 TaxID=3025503 RepID=UPI002FCD7797